MTEYPRFKGRKSKGVLVAGVIVLVIAFILFWDFDEEFGAVALVISIGLMVAGAVALVLAKRNYKREKRKRGF
jgi:O-antigen/teichoic acid export membrane protein